MNMLKKGSVFLNTKMSNSATEPVEYITGNIRRPCRAVLGHTSYEVLGEDGVLLKLESRDFIIHTDFLISKPKRGDIIKYNNETYEVMSIPGLDVFRFSDTFKKKYRIHTKLV